MQRVRTVIKMIKKLTKFVGQYKIFAILSPIFVALETVLEIMIPFLMSKIVNIGVNGDGGMPYILKIGGLMLVMTLCSLFFGAMSGKCAAKASTGFAKNLRGALFHKVQEFSFSNIDKFSTASLITRMTTDVTYAQHSFMMIIRSLVRSPVMLIFATVMAYTINNKLVFIFLFAIPVLAAAISIIAAKAYPRFGQVFKKYDKVNTVVQENLIGIRLVKAFVREDHESDKFRKTAEDLMNAQLKAEKTIIWNMPIMQLVVYTCIICVLWFGGNFIIDGTMLDGDLLSFITYINMILMSLMMISMVFVTIVMSVASVKRILEVLEEKIEITDDNASKDVVKDGSVYFKNVNFSYSNDRNNLTLKDINLDIKAGETVGVIGGTGTGKSSLVQLIPRLYDVIDGEVIVGGKNVKDYRLEDIRNAVAMVLQKNTLFSGTIRENLLWGNENATDEQLVNACKIAQAHDFIANFPKGYDHYVEQGGRNLSGGQKQRLCIARALLKNPKVVIMDDSTSAVDTATDSKIREGFKYKLKDVTTIIIAQRISSVNDADKIVIMDDGKINDVGTHEELLLRNPIYQEIYKSQQKGEK